MSEIFFYRKDNDYILRILTVFEAHPKLTRVIEEVVSKASFILWSMQAIIGSHMIKIILKCILKTSKMQAVFHCCLVGIGCSLHLLLNNTNYEIGLGYKDPERELIPILARPFK